MLPEATRIELVLQLSTVLVLESFSVQPALGTVKIVGVLHSGQQRTVPLTLWIGGVQYFMPSIHIDNNRVCAKYFTKKYLYETVDMDPLMLDRMLAIYEEAEHTLWHMK